MNAGKNPRIPVIAINHRPEVRDRQRFHQFQIIAKGFQSDSTPDIATGLRMSVWPKELIKHIFVQCERSDRLTGQTLSANTTCRCRSKKLSGTKRSGRVVFWPASRAAISVVAKNLVR